MTVIHWFRQDLRIADNPALFHAANKGDVLPIYILDDENAKEHAMGAASRVWLHHSLESLNASLDGKLQIFQGCAKSVLAKLIETHDIKCVTWNRCYEPWRVQRDKAIKSMLSDEGIEVVSANGSLLWEPWEVLKKDKTPYKVFTPFYKAAYLQGFREELPYEASQITLAQSDAGGQTIASLKLLPSLSWGDEMIEHWQVGEDAAMKKLQTFLDSGVDHYKKGRDFPAMQKAVSHLSPHLHFGEISPRQAWYETRKQTNGANAEAFLSELGWREFSYYLLYHFPTLPWKNFQPNFDKFPWRHDDTLLKAWQKGQTGFPIVDAGMRQLWQTGYMHNRVRMIVGSFLVKNLLIDWRDGEAWFWDCLVDADLASNSASWQWVAGSGADAAPYFRVFNPVIQGVKFDGQGDYTRQFVPELKSVPDKYLFCPWDAPQDVLEQAGVVLGDSYPKPIVDLKMSRDAALKAYEVIKSGAV